CVAAHQPFGDAAVGVAKQDIVYAVAIEIALSDDDPSVVDRAYPDRGSDCRAAVQQPRRDPAAAVAKQDVAEAIAVEIMHSDGRQTSNLVSVGLGEPECVVRTSHDSLRLAIGSWNQKLNRRAAGCDAPDFVVPGLAKPECSVGAGRNECRLIVF